MRATLIRIMGGICLILGLIFLSISMLGFTYIAENYDKTERVGSGEFAIDLPKTTVFQGLEGALYGILGSTLLLVSLGCHIALQLESVGDDVAFGLKLLDRRLTSPAQAPVEQKARLPNTEGKEATDSLEPEPKPTTQPTKQQIANSKIKTKCVACGKIVVGISQWSGRTASCPHCKNPIHFPTS